VKNWLIAWAVRLAFTAADRMPPSFLLSLGRAAGRIARTSSPGMLRLAALHAARCLPPAEAARIARSSFVRAGENLATCVLLRRKSVTALDWVAVPLEAREALVLALAEGRGAVFVSAHLGPFELLAATIAELGFRPAIVVRESYDPSLDVWVDAHRRARGIEVIHRGAPSAALQIVRALRAGRPVGFLPDLGGRVPKTMVQFLGQEAGFPVGPQWIAKRLRSPIIVGTLRPVGQGPIPRSRKFALGIERVELSGDLATVTQRVAHTLERAILGAPEDFPWLAATSASATEGPAAAAAGVGGGLSRIAAEDRKALDLSTICLSEGQRTWHEGSAASRA
jgi:Kdo2-lipid IVA lauroyltransferase/acyltransferase